MWANLTDSDAVKASRTVGRMAEAPVDTLAFLRERVKPCPTAAEGITRKLLTDLDSNSFEVREAAVKRLKELGLQAEPALRAALQAKPSLELRRRIEELFTAAAASAVAGGITTITSAYRAGAHRHTGGKATAGRSGQGTALSTLDAASPRRLGVPM